MALGNIEIALIISNLRFSFSDPAKLILPLSPRPADTNFLRSAVQFSIDHDKVVRLRF